MKFAIKIGRVAVYLFTEILMPITVPAIVIASLDKKIRRLPELSRTTFRISFALICGLIILAVWYFLFAQKGISMHL